MKSRIAVVLPYAVFVLLVVVSWKRWIEPYVDSGRELAVPWRVASGESLYRDVRFFHGPLGPYAAAAVDALAGRSLAGRSLFAGAVALVHLEILRRLAGRLLSRSRAAIAASVVVATTFFLVPGGCHLFPFSLDTSVAAAAVAGALLFACFDASRSRDLLAAACLAAALLSRPEMGLAAVLILAWETRLAARTARLIGPPLLAAGVVYLLVSLGTPYGTLRREGWLAIIGPPEAFRNIYAAYAGLDRPGLRLAELALASVLLLLLAAFLVGAAALHARARASRPDAARWIPAAATAALAAMAAAALRPPESLAETVSLLPPLVRVVPAAMLGALAFRVGRHLLRRAAGPAAGAIPDALLAMSALFGARLLLAAGYVGPYNGFLLPLPLAVAAALLYRGADRLAPGTGAALPALVSAALSIFLLFRVASLADFFRHPAWSRVETPAGALFLTEPVAGATRAALADLSARVPRGGTLVGFPEIGFANYVLGFRNPLPHEQFFPGHLDADEERDAIRRLEASPPEAIVYANVIAVGHGSRAFGKDYLRALDRFVRARFAPAASYGPGAGPDARVGDPQFFLEIRVPRRPGRP